MFRGLMAPVFTPFNDDFTISLSPIPKYVEFLKNIGIRGILVNGTTGEGMSMNIEERKQLAEVWMTNAKKANMYVMLQVGGAPLPDVMNLAKHAESIKADAILTLPDLFNKPKTIDELLFYLQIISTAAPNTSLFYYHNPEYTDVNLSMAELVEKAKINIHKFKGLKFTSTDLSEGYFVRQACKDDCVVYLGADQLLSAAVTLGFDSAIGTTYNMLPFLSDSILNILTGVITDQFKKAQEYQQDLNTKIKNITVNGKWVPSMKIAMETVSKIALGPCRPPLIPLQNENVKKIKKYLENISKY